MSEQKKGFCFIIMSFAEKDFLEESYKLAVKPVVEEMGYICERADEQHFNDRISEQIIKNIHNADIIIADLTEARPNCYYELGMAHALGKPVIHISRNRADIHFDVQDYNFIVYKNVVSLRSELKERIVGTEKTLNFRLLHITQSSDQDVSAEIAVLAGLPRIKPKQISLTSCGDFRDEVLESQAVLFSYTNGQGANDSISTVLNAMANSSTPLVTYCTPDPMPGQSYARLTSHKPSGVVVQMTARLEAELKRISS